MTRFELYKFVKWAVLATPACRDGVDGFGCPSCIADFVTDALILDEYVHVSDPSASI